MHLSHICTNNFCCLVFGVSSCLFYEIEIRAHFLSGIRDVIFVSSVAHGLAFDFGSKILEDLYL